MWLLLAFFADKIVLTPALSPTKCRRT
jgi:hypothetical protein